MTTLLLLPGMDGTGTLFSGFAAALGGRVNTKTVRYPTQEAMSYVQLTDIAREAIPPHGPFVLLGESFSGPVAVALAAEHPSRLKGVVLCCSFASNPRPLLAAPLKAILRWPVPLAPIPVLSAALMGGFSTVELRTALERAVGLVHPGVLRSRLAQVMDVDVLAQLRQIQVPVLYLRAAQDRLVPSHAAQAVQQACPTAQIVSLPGPHFLLQALPAESAAAVHHFLERLEKAA